MDCDGLYEANYEFLINPPSREVVVQSPQMPILFLPVLQFMASKSLCVKIITSPSTQVVVSEDSVNRAMTVDFRGGRI
jgi:hypothetical protein